MIVISSCGYQTESSMTLDEMDETKDPCVIVDEFQRAVKDFQYFQKNPVRNTRNDPYAPSSRVADVLLVYIFIFSNDSSDIDYKKCPNYVSTKEMIMQDSFLKEFIVERDIKHWDYEEEIIPITKQEVKPPAPEVIEIAEDDIVIEGEIKIEDYE